MINPTRICTFLLAASSFVLSLPSTFDTELSQPQCRCFPGDECWPNQSNWQTFNATVKGRLIDTTPIGSVCHGSTFNSELCSALRTNYNDAEVHYQSSSSVMAPFWANRSCDAFNSQEDRCIKGTYLQYAVKVETTADVVSTIKFATKRNIRLVIRNTGHDYLGKSTGAGALGLWMHHLKSFDVLPYRSKWHKGKAIKLGAGMLSVDATAEAHKHGLVIVGGNCPSVGLAGGYTQGGGIGPLTSRYGFGADQVLEWEVVTVDGKVVRASRDKNSDLYWALSGGGGGTYGIVVSMTVKAYPEERAAAASLTFSALNTTQDRFYEAVEAFHSVLPALSAAGGVSIYVVQSIGFGMTPAMLPGGTKEQLDKIFCDVRTKLQALNISYGK